MANWKEYRLGEIGSIVTGKTPSAKNPEHWGDVMPFVTPTDFDLYNKNIGSALRFLSNSGVSEFKNKVLPPKSVIVTCIGSQMGKVAVNEVECVTNQQINSIIPKRNFNSDFIYYVLSSMQGFLRNLATGGSTMPIVNKSSFEDITINVPDLPTQSAIAEILSSLDDKIELNNQINKNLEALAQALFKQWFVDFEFPNENGQPYKSSGGEMVESELGEIPKGWIKGVLSDIIDFNPNEKLSKGIESSYIDMAALPTQGSWPDKPIQRLAGSGMKFKNGDTLFARITPCLENGKTAFIQCLKEDEIAWGSTEFIVLRPKQPWPKELAYLIARDESFRSYAVQSMIGTSGRQRAQSSHLEKYSIVYPTDKKLIKLLNELLLGFFGQIKCNSQESEFLSELRDTLLPKLISGELNI
jgi:type I restriction enzyme S subunit